MTRDGIHIDENGDRYVFDPETEAGDPVDKSSSTKQSPNNGTDSQVLFQNGEVVG